MAQMTNQMKTKLTDYFHLVSGLKIYNLRKFFENGSRFFPKTALKIVFWTTPLGTKVPKRVLLFRQKFQKGSIERPYSGTPPCENIMSSPPGVHDPKSSKGLWLFTKTKVQVKRKQLDIFEKKSFFISGLFKKTFKH